MKETYSRTKSVWQRMDETERKAVMDYGEKYKAFLDTARTERLAAKEIIRQAEAKGFKPVYDMKSMKASRSSAPTSTPRVWTSRQTRSMNRKASYTSAPITTVASRSTSGPAFRSL